MPLESAVVVEVVEVVEVAPHCHGRVAPVEAAFYTCLITACIA